MPGTARMPLVWAFVTAFASLILAMILGRVASTVRLRRLSSGGDDLHGSARFATRKDIEKAGLLGQEEGLFVGGWIDGGMLHYLRHSGRSRLSSSPRPAQAKG